ncbi:MAG: DHH family phosphoesterase [Chloroflexi bacterium]|nr:DHH family phosphoesterase [Chloroflexota bacterium]
MLLPDMSDAVSRLTKALDAHELIGVFGDFDTDGITGTALLVRGLEEVGARVAPYLPDRLDEGHGLNDDAVRALTKRGVTLLVTVDCGTSSVDEIALAASLGADTIVTDHHNLTDNPPVSCALINPKRPDSAYPYPDLTGVGMAFKLVEALYADIGEPWPGHLLELVALGTVADVGPLTGENRFLVKEGIERLRTTQNPGIRALADVSKVKLASLATDDLSFRLIPRLNAPGRLGSARTSLDLLTAKSEEDAASLANELELMNSERRALTEEAMQEAERQVARNSGQEGVAPLVFVESEAWSPGILGLIAARLTDIYHRPAIAVARGSRSSRASRAVGALPMATTAPSKRGASSRMAATDLVVFSLWARWATSGVSMRQWVATPWAANNALEIPTSTIRTSVSTGAPPRKADRPRSTAPGLILMDSAIWGSPSARTMRHTTNLSSGVRSSESGRLASTISRLLSSISSGSKAYFCTRVNA